jgi:hypothetical protein
VFEKHRREKMSWYNENYENYDANKKKQEEESLKEPSRFWMRAGDEGREIIFIDSTAFSFWEHVVYKDGSFKDRKYYTCCRDLDPKGCPLCDAGNKRYLITMFTIIDTTEWMDREGRVFKNLRRLLALKTEAAGVMRQIKKSRGGNLVGYKCLFMRSGDKSAGTGNHVNFIGEVDLNDEEFVYTNKDGKKFVPSAYDYKKIFAPKSRDELFRALRASSGEEEIPYNSGNGSDDPGNYTNANGEDDSDIPF